ncbi:MATE family efflux transporter [candidate division KSB1 bacterium]|nr:MATE family efflux transporter [candidate division KSB1 bacterium]
MADRTPLKQILKTSLPAVIDLSSQTIMWTIEAILIAQLGVAVFAGVGMATQLTVVIFTVLITFVVGATFLITRHLGAQDKDQANHILAQALILGIIISVAIALFLYHGAPHILKIIRESDSSGSQVAQKLSSRDAELAGITYLRTVSFFIPLILTNFIGVGIIRGSGDTHLSMMINVTINLLNFVLAVVLIFGLFGFPRLEVHGAALAVGIAHSTGFLITLLILRSGKSTLYLSFKELVNPNLQTFKKLFKLGIPTTIEQMVWATGMLVVTSFAAYAGITVLATHQVFVKIQAILSMMYLGFGLGAMTLMGKNIGADQHYLVEKTAQTASRVVFVFVILVTIFLITFAESLVSIFARDRLILRMGSICMVMFAITQIPKAMNGIVIGNLRGCGDLKWLMWTTIGGVILFEIGLNWIFLISLAGKVTLLFALWAVQGADETLRYFLNYWRFKGGKWKFIDNF